MTAGDQMPVLRCQRQKSNRWAATAAHLL